MKTGFRSSHLSYSRNDRPLFSDLCLALAPGQGLVVYGPNGSGKTSLLRVLAGLQSPEAGELFWEEAAISASRADYHQALHYLGHHTGLKSTLTVRENLAYSQMLASLKPLDEKTTLQRAGLAGLENMLVQRLSAGQKRRLALSRLLASPKKLWILDEPFTNLDAAGQQWVLALLEEHLENQGIAIVASHQALKLSRPERVLSLRLAAAERLFANV